MLNPGLITATVCSVGVVLVLYAVLLGKANNNDDSISQLRVESQQGLSGLLLVEKIDFNSQNCPRMKAVKEMVGRPIWLAGYPGSGFDLVAPLIASVTGLAVVGIYQQHDCTMPVTPGAAPTGACLTHWPLNQKDSPASVAVATGIQYSPRAILILRNPAQAIPCYHTRLWRSQQKIDGNRDQPPQLEWIEWRNRRFDHHLNIWRKSIVAWKRGVPAAGIKGVSMYLPFEQLIDVKNGPALTAELADQFAPALGRTNPVAGANATACLWRRNVKEERRAPKLYAATYTPSQKDSLLQTLDNLLLTDAMKEPVLTKILQGYRTDIANHLPLDNDN